MNMESLGKHDTLTREDDNSCSRSYSK